MTIADYKQLLGDHGKDTKLNLSNLFGNVDSSGLTADQFYGTALSLVYAMDDKELIAAVEAEAEGKVEANVVSAAKNRRNSDGNEQYLLSLRSFMFRQAICQNASGLAYERNGKSRC